MRVPTGVIVTLEAERTPQYCVGKTSCDGVGGGGEAAGYQKWASE